MAKESKEEGRVVAAREKQFSGKPDKAGLTGKYSLEREIPSGMKTPKAPGDSNRQMSEQGNGMKANMGQARAHLERETERGAHVAQVGGHKMHGHSGSMKE